MPDRAGATLLAFDFGTKRIGVAVGDTVSKLAHPLATIESEQNDARFAAIAALIEEWRPARLLVGLPLTLDGEAHDMTARCRRFANQLHGRFRLPVALVDERLSSAAAETALRDAGATTRQLKSRKGRIDAVAAQLILQSYFDGGETVLDLHVPHPA